MARRRPGGNFGNFGAESFSKQPQPEVYKVKPIKAEFGGSAPDSLYSSNRESSWTRWRKGWELAVADGARKSFNYPFTYTIPFPPILHLLVQDNLLFLVFYKVSQPKTKNWVCTGLAR